MVFYIHVKVSSSPLCPLCMTRSCIFDWWLCTCMYVVCPSVTVLLAILLFRLRWKGRSQGTREEGADPQCQVLVGAMEGAARTMGKGLTRVSLNCSVQRLLFWGWIANAVHTHLFQDGEWIIIVKCTHCSSLWHSACACSSTSSLTALCRVHRCSHQCYCVYALCKSATYMRYIS